jgi:putative ABC transport system permease protein
MKRFFSMRSLGIGVHASWLEMTSNRFRSLLTLMGIALAVGVVTVMTAFQTGTQQYMTALVSEMGGVGKVGMRQQEANSPRQEAVFTRSPGVRLADADSLNNPQDFTVRATRMANARLNVNYWGQGRRTQVRGVDEKALIEDEKVLVESGRFFIPMEYVRGERVAVVGWRFAEEMQRAAAQKHGSQEVPGSVIEIAGMPYTVIGVFTRRYKQFDQPGRFIYVPIASMIRDFTGDNPTVEWLTLQIDATAPDSVIEGPLSALLKTMHRGAQDFSFRLFDFIADYATMMNNLRAVFWLISGIALLVGGVNILNVMLSTLAERVQEIGVRKALGATPMQIFLQFVVESVTLSLAGGILGTLLGLPILLFQDILEKATGGIKPVFTPDAFVWIFGLTVLMGIASGLYPAIKAARLSPIDALRYE